MKKLKTLAFISIFNVFGILLVGCTSNPSQTQPLANFQPEIVNNSDNFSFQATAVQNVSATVLYTWSNSRTQATINHSSAIDSGSAMVKILDANNIEVYNNVLMSSGTPATTVGVAGNWTIKVTLTNVYGTLNFNTQKR